MSKIFPITYSRYSRALARRIAPEDVKVAPTSAKPASTKVQAPAAKKEPAASPRRVESPKAKAAAVKTEYVTLPRRVETPEAFSPRSQKFGYDELLTGIAERTSLWYLKDDAKGYLRIIEASAAASALLNCVLATAYDNGFRVSVQDLRTGEPIPANVRKTHELFRAQRRVHLRLIDQRSDAHDLMISVESWARTPEGHLSSPENNSTLSRLWNGTLNAQDTVENALGEVNTAVDLKTVLPGRVSDEVGFDIDWVFSWVNGDDPDWKEIFAQWAPEAKTDAVDKSRFETRDDLKYALRSLEEYAPWIRTVYVLTNCKPPAWLDTSNPRIKWIDHSEVFAQDDLPTFSSHAIETVLHKIPGLSEHFVYSNDDFFLMRPTLKSDFFYANGLARLRLEAYGMVNGPVTEGEPDYLNAARNSAALITNEFGTHPVRLHTHSPQSMNRKVLEEMEILFSDQFQQTRQNKFRHSTDIAVTGFLYHHYAFAIGRAVPDGGSTRLIQQNHNFVHLFNTLIEEKRVGKKSKFVSICVNDGMGSSDNPQWGKSALNFVNRYFPDSSVFEQR